jgi:hypothetical protein
MKTNTNKEMNLYIADDFTINNKKSVYFTGSEYFVRYCKNLYLDYIGDTNKNNRENLIFFDKSILNKSYNFFCYKRSEILVDSVPNGSQAWPQAYYCKKMISKLSE